MAEKRKSALETVDGELRPTAAKQVEISKSIDGAMELLLSLIENGDDKLGDGRNHCLQGLLWMIDDERRKTGGRGSSGRQVRLAGLRARVVALSAASGEAPDRTGSRSTGREAPIRRGKGSAPDRRHEA